MAELRNVCVYCGSNRGTSPGYAAAAEDLGRQIAEAGLRLVYGGGSIGLMGIVAHAVLTHGGPVTGIIPQFLKDREVMLQEVTDLIVTADMHERKRTMFERADAFVALPGGIGTLEEVVEVMTWAQLEQHEKPILFVNIDGFWNPLIAQFDVMTDTGFLHKDFLGDHPALPARFCNGIEDVIPTLQQAVADLPQPALDESAKLM
ncbi:MAG: TIGR00730 family Rossman fold protein [Hyphomicrobiales bacterium]|nr:TIGR00730 family Rossman fold protein [Hyphomicrobiales bacterium]